MKNKVYIYNLDSAIESIIVKDNTYKVIKPDLNPCEILSKQNDYDIDFFPNWVFNNIKLGNLGEIIAEKYFASIFQKVQRVSTDDSSLGYDFVCDDEYFEIKCSYKGGLNFYLSSNEIKVSENKSNAYNIFYIHFDKNKCKVTGYILNDPNLLFNISKDKFKHHYSNGGFDIYISNIYIQADDDFLSSYKAIDITGYHYEVIGK